MTSQKFWIVHPPPPSAKQICIQVVNQDYLNTNLYSSSQPVREESQAV